MLNGPLREEAATGAEGGGAGAGEGGAGTDTGAGAPDPAAELAAIKAENATLKATAAEKEEAARYWHEQAKGKTATAATAKETKTDEETDPDLLELITSKGVKGLDEVLAKRGFVRQEDVDGKINAKATIIAAENKLGAEYPDLKDTNSEFFKATAVHYKPLVDAGVPQHIAMQLAAEKAELEGYKTGKRLTPTEKAERAARAAAQNPDKTKKAAATEEEEGTGELDDFQLALCEKMEITPEQYRARAKTGVNIGGRHR